MDLYKFIGFISQMGVFMVIFSVLYFAMKIIFSICFSHKDRILFKRIYLTDCLSIVISLVLIYNFIHIYPNV